MDYDEFKSSLQHLKTQFKQTPGLVWRKPLLRPKINPLDGEIMGWMFTWAITFESSQHFVRFKENWTGSGADFSRDFFTYHYGPYEPHWVLETVECKLVIVRIDGVSYFGRGYHIHDGDKEKRIFQDELKHPDLAAFTMGEFMESALKIRYGKTVAEAFGLEPK
jgi:hypothetical protein